MRHRFLIGLWGCIALMTAGGAYAQSAFVNWENPHVHPIDLTPDHSKLLAVNTPDNRLEVFDVTGKLPVSIGSIPVGLDPVSVRARTDAEVWVVNHISDSVSVVSLTTMNVVATLSTLDEPADVVFAGSPMRAFVSCSQANAVRVFDPADLNVVPTDIPIDAEDPRAMAVSADGTQVYVAIFESGNKSTLLGGGVKNDSVLSFPPNVVSDANGPYNGTNPPTNNGTTFNPPFNEALPSPPKVGLIVKQDAQGRWEDDNGTDWTAFVNGESAAQSGRPTGWDLLDRDVAIIDVATLSVSGYATGLMNLCMAIAVHPVAGRITVVGTDATNEIRFEPVINGRFLRVNLGIVDPAGPNTVDVVDLNGDHLDYSDNQMAQQSDPATASQALRDNSIGDPRAVAWNADGSRGYVAGMGSNNVIVIDANGGRLSPVTGSSTNTIEVGEGPTGLALDPQSNRLYVMNKFDASISVVDLTDETETAQVAFFDPTPSAIKTGRKHLYDTRLNSALGHIACGSCHADSRMDRLAWDLGNPAGDMKTFDQNCLAGADDDCEDWHPMKGPMITQTLQDIIGHEPLHWRGDRFGIEEFSGAFMSLQGDDQTLTTEEMQEFANFLSSIHFPPNAFRNIDNTLPTNLPLPGHFANGRFVSQGGLDAGAPLPNGNAQRGLDAYRDTDRKIDQGAFACVTCHTLPTGMGTDTVLSGPGGTTLFEPAPLGPFGEHHASVNSVDGSTNITMKIVQLRNLYDKVGCEMTQTTSRAGFGVFHDGSVDSIARFVSEGAFDMAGDQEVADFVALMLAFSGSELPDGSLDDQLAPLGPPSQDTHAAVGQQITFNGNNNTDPEAIGFLGQLQTLADMGAIGLVAKGIQNGEQRGYQYTGSNNLQADRAGETTDIDDLRVAAGPGAEVTFTAVPIGSERRIGIDRNQDGVFDGDEGVCGADAADADLDGIADLCDNCPAIANSDQLDDDDDGIGNVCDPTPGLSACGTGLCGSGAVPVLPLTLLCMGSMKVGWRRQLDRRRVR